ncbi:MAG: transposase [Clostridia bacterium]|nr:transposase [Clostridia bacterium]
MPRTSRVKSEESMYHIMSRSISEVDLFQDDGDKDRYLMLLKQYIEKFHCKIYAYSLMDNHVHLYINPEGFDISTFMKSLNSAYVAYFNKQHQRHGHLFQGRFASKIVDNDTYSLTLSAYIHNNAKDLPGYAGKEEIYRYSSYGIYTGARKDTDKVIDKEFLLGHFSNDESIAKEKMRAFTESMRDTGIMKEVDANITRAYTGNVYNSEKRRIIRPGITEELIKRMSELLGQKHEETLKSKYNRQTSNFRAFTAYIMRVLCDFSYKKICEYVGNMSMSGVSALANKGFRLLKEQILYQNAFYALLT